MDFVKSVFFLIIVIFSHVFFLNLRVTNVFKIINIYNIIYQPAVGREKLK